MGSSFLNSRNRQAGGNLSVSKTKKNRVKNGNNNAVIPKKREESKGKQGENKQGGKKMGEI